MVTISHYPASSSIMISLSVWRLISKTCKLRDKKSRLLGAALDLIYRDSLQGYEENLVWFPNPLAPGSQMGTLSIFIIRWCARHLFFNWHWPKLNCLGQTIQLQIVFSVLTCFRTSQSCQQAGRWCRGGVWTLYLAITAHFTSWWLFQMYCRRYREWGGGRRSTIQAFPPICIHFRWWSHDHDGRLF